MDHLAVENCIKTLNFHETPRPMMAEILVAVALETMIAIPSLKGESRFKPYVRARRIFYWIAHKNGYSFPRIGAFVCRDHSTAVHGFQSCERDFAAYAQIIAAVEKRLEGVGR